MTTAVPIPVLSCAVLCVSWVSVTCPVTVSLTLQYMLYAMTTAVPIPVLSVTELVFCVQVWVECLWHLSYQHMILYTMTTAVPCSHSCTVVSVFSVCRCESPSVYDTSVLSACQPTQWPPFQFPFLCQIRQMIILFMIDGSGLVTLTFESLSEYIVIVCVCVKHIGLKFRIVKAVSRDSVFFFFSFCMEMGFHIYYLCIEGV